MIQIDSGLVRKLDSVESQVLVGSSRRHPRGLFSKVELSPCAGTTHTGTLHTAVRPVKTEECARHLLPLRVPHGLIKGKAGAQRSNGTQRDFFSIGELSHPAGILHSPSGQDNKEGGGWGCNLLPLSVPHGLIKGLQNKVNYRPWLVQMYTVDSLDHTVL